MRLLRRSMYLVLALVLAGGAGAVSCNGSGRGNSAGASGAVSFRLNVINQTSVRPGSSYQIIVTWGATLVQAGAGSGVTDPQLITKTYTGTVGGPGAPDPHSYQVSYSAGPWGFPALHMGVWTFTVATDLESWSTSCQQELSEAVLSVNFTHGKDGCMTGAQFP
jgi:hypothetical protein